MQKAQKIATKVFIVASLAFGVLGIINVLIGSHDNSLLMKLQIVTVFIVLPSFAVSIAGKYLNGKS
jgi:hypothetical protein